MDKKKRKRVVSIIVTIIIIVILLLLLVKCSTNKPKQEVIKQEDTTIVEPSNSEKQEEIIVEPTTPIETEIKTDTKDITNMYYWVVFYDQYGNELQRKALKYGTVPSFKGALPEGFDKWNKTIKAITGNTYYKAICNEVHHSSGGSGSNPTPTPSGPNYLWFKGVGTENTTIKLTIDGSPTFTAPDLEYSLNTETWNPIVIDTPIDVCVGSKVYIRAVSTNDRMGYCDGSTYYDAYYFASDDSDVAHALEVGGSIMTLLDPTNTDVDISGKDGCFYWLFGEMYNLTSANSLICPAQTLAPYCYNCLLAGCENLKSVNPYLLPAIDLSGCEGCYMDLFNGDYALENVPNLPATTLAPDCYYTMFVNCTSIVSVPSGLLPAIDLTGCDTCCASMFSGCTSLAIGPNLPATILAEGCYQDMFYNCNSLTGLTVGFTSFDGLPVDATSGWFHNVDNTFGVFKWGGATSGVTKDYDHVPPNWTISN